MTKQDSTEQYTCVWSTDQASHENIVSSARSSPLSSISEYEQQLALDLLLNSPGIIVEEPRKGKRLILECVEIPQCKALDKRKQLSNVEPSGVTQSQAQPETETSNSPNPNIPELMDNGETSKQTSSTANAMGDDLSTRKTNTGMDVGEGEQQQNRSGGDIIPVDVSAGDDAIAVNKWSSEGSRTKVGSRGQNSVTRRRGTKIKMAVTRTSTKAQSQAGNQQTASKKVGGRTHADASHSGKSRPEPSNELVRPMLVKV